MTAAGIRAILDGVDDVAPLRGVKALRSLVSRGEEVECLLEVISAESDALMELPEVADAFDRLGDHRDTLARLYELSELADDLEHLVRALRTVRGYRSELEWAAESDAVDEE